MRLTSPAFVSGGPLPPESATPRAGGHNTSPPLRWEGEPEGTRSFALEVVDRSARDWVHWLVLDIPAQTHSLPPGASGRELPGRAHELRNTFGTLGWGGPQPPPGTGQHRYEAVIYALDSESTAVEEDADASAFERAIRRHVLDRAVLVGVASA